MAQIENLRKVVETLRRKAAAKSKEGNVSVVVGYTASYALQVHENVEMKWRGLPRSREVRLHKSRKFVTFGHSALARSGLFWGPSGQAKFLEGPARRFADRIGQIVRQGLQKEITLAQALLRGGLFLQRESQKVVPVDTGNLRASAFTRLESGVK